MKPSRSLLLFIKSFLLIFVVGITIQVVAQTIADLRATNTARLVVDNNNNGLADGGDVIEYTVQIANCSPNTISGMNYQSDIDPNTQLIPNSVQVTIQGTGLCGGTVDNPPPPPPPTPIPPPVNPIVTTTTPADNATEVALNSNISITFSEDVVVAGDWFEMVCSTSGTFNLSSANIAVTGGPSTFILNPNIDLQVGETCVVTVFASGVTDSEALNPLADYVFDFTTETPPTITATNPLNGAVGVLNTTDIIITFDEPVTFTAASFTLECPSTVTFSGGFAVSGSGTNVATINPTGNLPSGTTCQVTVIAAQLTDVDVNDPPDLLDGNNDNVEGDNYVFGFTTDVDAAPTVITVDPANGATSVPNSTNITITFSELVDITSAADFALECGGMPQGYTVITPATLPASTTTVVIDPASPLPDASLCQVTVFTSVTDSDMDDPPNNMAANFVWSFTTEAPPSVTTTNPANGAINISTSTNIVINFDEPVDVTTSSFTIECPAGGTSFLYTIAGSGTTSITLDPTVNLLANQTCTVTVIALQVSDSDPIDPPNNMLADYVFSFDTVADTAPVASSPLDGATGVATSTNIVINFNEPVDVTAGAFVVECPVGSPVAFTTIPALSTTNQTSITIDPTGNLPATTTCAVAVLQANVTDTDTDEPPDNMAADYNFVFSTIVDLAPTVNQAGIAPASTSTGPNSASLNNPVSTTPTITIPFSEAVDVASGGFTLVCNATPLGVNVTPALPALGATSLDISPSVALAQGANCVLTVVAANVTDSDTDDPPNLMVNDFTLSFAVDTAPAETLTETEVGNTFQDVTGAGAINVDLDSNIQITFNEAVTITFPANGLQCPIGNNIPVTVTTNNAATIVLNPDVNLPLNTLCVLNIPAANISDVDTADAPDNPVAGVNHTFTTVDDDAPTVMTNPAMGSSNIAINSNITVTFNEPVTLTGAWFTLSCTVSGVRVSTGELTGTGITIIENALDLVYTIVPAVNFAPGDVCTITIDSANVVDNDLIDPPNELDGDNSGDVTDGDADDYVAVFSTTDLPPQVVSTTPTSTATVGANQAVTLNFSEQVNIAAGAFTFECNATPITGGFNTSVVLPASAVTTITLTPVNPLPFGANCVVTAISSLVVDSDPVDPPNFLDGDNSGDLIDDVDNFVLNFNVDAQPTLPLPSIQVEIANVLSPASGAVNVDLDTNIVLTFSEPVNAGVTSFTLDCAGPIAFTVSGSGTATITIDPTPAALPINTLCDLDIIAANITDVDTFDPPDTLPADISLTFTTINDNPPSVFSAEAEVSSVFTALSFTPPTYADPDTDLRITFSEAVTVTGNWAQLSCTITGIQDVTLGLAVTDADPVFTLNPATNLTFGEDCTLTIFASQVADEDVPIQNMGADAVFTFTVQDTPPRVDTLTSTPIDGATVPNTQTVTINFTEMVDIQAGGIVFVCNITPVAFTPALPQNNVTSITLVPSVALTNGAACTVTLVSTLITDDDTVDGPDDLDGSLPNDIINGDADNFVLNFAVDTPPQVSSNTPVDGTANVPITNNIVIDFNELVNIAAGGITVDCGAGLVSFTPVLPIGPVTTININPDSDLPNGAQCTVTVVATNVTDNDAFDPPNLFDGDFNGIEGDNYVFRFTTIDTPPQVVSTIPTGSPTTPNNQTVTINFSEAVDIALSGITWQCGVTTIGFTPALSQNNVTSIVLTPLITLPSGAICTVTLESTLITDVDTVDSPHELDGNGDNDVNDSDADDYVFTFTVDAPPRLTTTPRVEVGGVLTFLPLVGAQRADIDTDIIINFNENVDATVTGVTLECPAGSPIPFAGLPVANNNTITINPTSDLPGGTTCVLLLVHTGITDTDIFDPPNLFDGNGDGVEGDSIGFVFTTQSIANDDAYTVTPHLTYTSSVAGLSVRDNDNPVTATITGFGPTIGTANSIAPNGVNFITAGGAGGRVIMNTDGTFIFYPDAGDDNLSGTVTFFYTITGGDTAQVTLTFEAEEFIWFVDGSGACTTSTGTNLGTQACPATDMLGAVQTNDTANDIIFIADGPYTCGITLQNGEWVIGDGSTSTLAAIVAPRVTPVVGSDFAPYNTFSGTDPILNNTGNCFILGQNNIVRGLRVSNTSGYAFIDNGGTVGTFLTTEVNVTDSGGILNLTNGGTINAAFETLTSTSHTGRVINLTNMTGAISNTGGAITNAANADTIAISGGTVSLTLFSTVSKTGGTGGVLTVSGGHATGTLNFLSAVSHSSAAGNGVLFNNADGNYLVNGNLNISAGTAGVNIENDSAGTFTFVSAGSSITGVAGISFRVNNSTANVDYNGSITHTSQANRGIEIITGTGIISFDGDTQIGTIANPMLSAVGVFLDATGNANPISFADLNIITGIGGGAGSQAFVSQTSGRIAVTTGDIECNGNLGADTHCFDVTDTISNGVTFATILSDHDGGGEQGGAIFLNNTSGTFTFQQNLRMSGFNASIVQANNFGTLNIGTVATATIGTTNRPAVNINNGVINITAESVSMFGGAANGIVIQNTTGSFTVTGTGAASSGGTINNTTGHGINLNNVTNISLNNMLIQNSALSGVYGTEVTNFAFTNGQVSNVGTAASSPELSCWAFNLTQVSAGEFLPFNNLDGTLTLTNNTCTNPYGGGLDVTTYGGTITNATVTGNTFTSTTSTTTSTFTAITFRMNDSPSSVSSLSGATISNNIINNFPSGGGISVGGNVSEGANTQILGSVATPITISNNTISGLSAANRIGTQGILLFISGRGSMYSVIDNNSITHVTGNGISASAFGDVTARVFVTNNTIVANNSFASQGIGGGPGVDGTFGVSGNLYITVTGNNISQVDGNGILLVSREGSSILNADVRNNTVAAPLTGVRPGIRIDSGLAASIDTRVCLNIQGNISAGSGGHPGLGLRKQGAVPTTNDFAIVGMVATATPGVEAYVDGLNPLGNGTLLISATSGFTNCTLP